MKIKITNIYSQNGEVVKEYNTYVNQTPEDLERWKKRFLEDLTIYKVSVSR